METPPTTIGKLAHRVIKRYRLLGGHCRRCPSDSLVLPTRETSPSRSLCVLQPSSRGSRSDKEATNVPPFQAQAPGALALMVASCVSILPSEEGWQYGGQRQAGIRRPGPRAAKRAGPAWRPDGTPPRPRAYLYTGRMAQGGEKGGRAVSRDPAYMTGIGRRGGAQRKGRRAAARGGHGKQS
jgi:hypothetical protein